MSNNETIEQSSLIKARQVSLAVRAEKRRLFLEDLYNQNRWLVDYLDEEAAAKIALTMLYLGEGTKNPKRGGLVFANSDPYIIKLFLKLLRQCYDINPLQLHCTVQCRIDQDEARLAQFWSGITDIPLKQFYKAQKDPRTAGKPLKNLDYKGVCRIDYLSAIVFQDLLQTIAVLTGR